MNAAADKKSCGFTRDFINRKQLIALIMGPGGYSVADFMKAGGIMTILFLMVMIFMMNLVY